MKTNPRKSKYLTKLYRSRTVKRQGDSHVADCYATWKEGGVWMVKDNSAARALAEDMMRVTGLMGGHDDWRTRDKIILAISDRLAGMLDWTARRFS